MLVVGPSVSGKCVFTGKLLQFHNKIIAAHQEELCGVTVFGSLFMTY